MAENTENPSAGLSLRHLPLVVTGPAAVFAKAEDTGAYGPALGVILALAILLGYAEVQTGLIDRVVDQQTEQQLAEIEKTQYGVVDRLQLKDAMEAVRKNSQFMKMLRRLGAVVLTPLYMLTSFLVISSILYALVAMSGRKPEWHTLMSICVYAGVIDLIAIVLRLAMMMTYRTTSVDTSLRMLGQLGKPTLWGAIDPFRMWFWVLIALGVTTTRQLSRRAAIVTCLVLFLLSTGARVGTEYLLT